MSVIISVLIILILFLLSSFLLQDPCIKFELKLYFAYINFNIFSSLVLLVHIYHVVYVRFPFADLNTWRDTVTKTSAR